MFKMLKLSNFDMGSYFDDDSHTVIDCRFPRSLSELVCSTGMAAIFIHYTNYIDTNGHIDFI